MNKKLLLVPVVIAALLPVAVHAEEAPPETGCRNIVDSPSDSAATWDRLLERIAQSGDGSYLRPYSKATPVWKDVAVGAAEIQLAEPSCHDVLYTATFSKALPGEDGASYTTGDVVATMSARGDGTSSRVLLRDVVDLGEDCVRVSLSTMTPGGKQIDRAPDAGEATICRGGGGGQTFGS